MNDADGSSTDNQQNSHHKFDQQTQQLLQLANSQYVSNNIPECIKTLQNLVQINPRCHNAYYTLGLIFEEREEHEQAYRSYLLAAHTKKQDIKLWQRLYEYSYILDHKEDRIEFINKIIRLKKENKKIKTNKKKEEDADITDDEIMENEDETIYNLIKEKYNLYESQNNIEKSIETIIELIPYEGFPYDLIENIKENIRNSTDLVRAMKKLVYIILHPGMMQLITNHPYLPKPSKEMINLIIVSLFELELFNLLINLFNELEDYEWEPKQKLIFILSREFCSDSSNDFSYFESFLSDETNWKDFKEFQMALTLCEILQEKGLFSACMNVLIKLRNLFEEGSKDPMLRNILNRLAQLALDMGDKNSGLQYYLELHALLPEDNQIKAIISGLYEDLGDTANALHFASSLTDEVNEYIDDANIQSKKDFRHSVDECKNTRMLYNKAMLLYANKAKEQTALFINTSNQLIRQFLNNIFIFVPPNTNFNTFLMRNERNVITQKPLGEFNYDAKIKEIYSNDTNNPIRELRRTNIRLMSLHGLDVDEWFNILKMNVVAKIELMNYTDASALLIKSLEAHIFRGRSDIFIQLVAMGMKFSLINNDIDNFLVCIKKAIFVLQNNDYYFLLFFFCNFFIEYYKKKNYLTSIKNLQRVGKRKLMSRNIKNKCHKIALDDLVRLTRSKLAKKENENQNEGEDVDYVIDRNVSNNDKLIFLCSYIPNFIYTESVGFIDKVFAVEEPSLEINILLASIYATHTKSRAINNRYYYVKKSFNVINKLMGKGHDDVVNYNIGRLYQHYGVLGMAECFYKKALLTNDMELKQLAKFNLLLIYKRKNVELWKALMRY
ncbi:Transcription factor tau [Astathelohania contejeani]|uniref:Transcription factor tau n=1 Tax=Astathelohania contejeani TaxID=164912 RepID=A0ABQ7HVK3_9MICR|nr:Transcription factor tau [Thelohania contejeani]